MADIYADLAKEINRRSTAAKAEAERKWIEKHLGTHYTPEELRNIRDHYFEMAKELGIRGTDNHDEWRELNDGRS